MDNGDGSIEPVRIEHRLTAIEVVLQRVDEKVTVLCKANHKQDEDLAVLKSGAARTARFWGILTACVASGIIGTVFWILRHS